VIVSTLVSFLFSLFGLWVIDGFENDRYQTAALWTIDPDERLDVVMLFSPLDREKFQWEILLIIFPVA
jgi:hypothetical protein